MKKQLVALLGLSLAFGLAGCDAPSETSEVASSASSSTATSSQAVSSSSSESTSKVTVTFDPANGKKKTTVQVDVGGKVSKPETDPTFGGKKFLGWFNGDTAWDFENNTVSEAITLTAHWELDTDYFLEDTEAVEVKNEYGEFSIWDGSVDVKFHNKEGKWNPNEDLFPYGTGWETMMIFDADGKVCFGLWCANNGYGVPAAYSYMHDVKYSKDNLTYEGNPAIVLGDDFAADANDFELVIPTGGFAITGHNPDEGGTGGTDIMARLVTGGEWTQYTDTEKDAGITFSASHCEYTSARKFVYNSTKARIEVYRYATYLNFTGARSGVGTGTSEGVYTTTVKIPKNQSITLKYNNGLKNKALSADKLTVTGDYASDSTTELKIFTTENDRTLFTAGSTGMYTFEYTLDDDSLKITAAEIEKDDSNTVSFKNIVDATACPENGISCYPAGTKFHTSESGWAATGCSEWASFLVIDADGKIVYFCANPTSGYGGYGGTYFSASKYADYSTNPCFTKGDGWAAWSEEDGTSCEKFDFSVPTGCLGFVFDGNPLVTFIDFITDGEISEYDDSGAQKYAINCYRSTGDKITFAYDSSKKVLTGTILKSSTATLVAEAVDANVEADNTLSVWSEGTVFYNEENGWANATGTVWRSYGIVDSQGRLAYFCQIPQNGYGGPSGGTYLRHSCYEDYTNNPAIVIHDGYGPWTEEAPGASKKWELKVPTGGFGFSSAGSVTNSIAEILTIGEFTEVTASNRGDFNKFHACVDRITITRNEKRITFTTAPEQEAVNLQAKLESTATALPAIYTHATENVIRDDYAIGVDSTGKVIYAQYCGDGYSCCNDAMYTDQEYTCEAGTSFCVFNVQANWHAWKEGVDTENYDKFTVRAPEGGYIITGSLSKMNPFFQAIFDVDMSDYSNDTFFKSVVDGSVNDKVVTIAVNVTDATVYDITVR